MASNIEFIEYVCSQLEGAGNVRYRKMFGDYMVYVNDKPVILICDNIAYVKKHPAISDFMKDPSISDKENEENLKRMIDNLEKTHRKEI